MHLCGVTSPVTLPDDTLDSYFIGSTGTSQCSLHVSANRRRDSSAPLDGTRIETEVHRVDAISDDTSQSVQAFEKARLHVVAPAFVSRLSSFERQKEFVGGANSLVSRERGRVSRRSELERANCAALPKRDEVESTDLLDSAPESPPSRAPIAQDAAQRHLQLAGERDERVHGEASLSRWSFEDGFDSWGRRRHERSSRSQSADARSYRPSPSHLRRSLRSHTAECRTPEQLTSSDRSLTRGMAARQERAVDRKTACMRR